MCVVQILWRVATYICMILYMYILHTHVHTLPSIHVHAYGTHYHRILDLYVCFKQCSFFDCLLKVEVTLHSL